MPRVIGIDFGFSKNTDSLGYSQFHTLLTRAGTYVMRVVAETQVTSLNSFEQNFMKCRAMSRAKLIALDAPVTPVRISNLPAIGRSVEGRFSRGDFSNGNKGPQPSSIRVPKQGWPLYCAAMGLIDQLATLG